MMDKIRIKRVAAYIRVSTLEQANNGHSLQMQYDELTKWAQENDCIIHDYYIDDGYTATNLKRPALQRMLAESNDFDMIIFVKLDRFSRGVANYYKVMERLEETNTHWKAIFEQFDTTTTQGRTVINLYLTIAQQEAEIASERTKATIKSCIARGECIFSNPPRGYKREVIDGVGRMLIDEKKAAEVKAAFEHFINYGSIRGALFYVNNELGANISRRTFEHMLTNKIYFGTYEHENYGTFPNYCEPIITEQQFWKAQEIRKKNRKERPQSKRRATYIFAGMIYCPQCGFKQSGTNQTDYRKKNPKVRLLYRCTRHSVERTCTYKYPIPETRIEKFLLENVRKMLDDKIITYKIEQEKAAVSPTAEMKKRIKVIEKKMAKLKDLYLEDMIQRSEYEKDYSIYNNELTELRLKIEESERNIKHFDISIYEKFLEQDFEDIYHTLTQDDKRRLWLSVIDSMIVDGHDITVKFF